MEIQRPSQEQQPKRRRPSSERLPEVRRVDPREERILALRTELDSLLNPHEVVLPTPVEAVVETPILDKIEGSTEDATTWNQVTKRKRREKTPTPQVTHEEPTSKPFTWDEHILYLKEKQARLKRTEKSKEYAKVEITSDTPIGIVLSSDWHIGCLKKDARIAGGEWKTMEDIRVGDIVWNKNGEEQKVKDIFAKPYTGDLYTIKPIKILPLTCTDNHPILVIKGHGGAPSKRRWFFKKTEPVWVRADEARVGDYVLVPKLKKSKKILLNFPKALHRRERLKTPKYFKRQKRLDMQLARILGLYMAEGWTTIGKNSYMVGFAFSEKETEYVDFVCKFLEETIGIKTHLHTQWGSTTITAHSRPLALFLREHFGHKASNKKVPNFIFKAGNKLVREFIKGYFEGDGCLITRKGRTGGWISLVTVSKTLALQLPFLLTKLNILPSVVVTKKGTERLFRGRSYMQKDMYQIQIGKQEDIKKILTDFKGWTQIKNDKRYFEDANYFYVPIMSIQKEKWEGQVYNIETEDNTFSTSFITHNSEGTDYDTFNRHMKLIKEEPNAFLTVLSNTIDGYIWPGGMWSEIAHVPEQVEIAKQFALEWKDKLLAVVGSRCHDWSRDKGGISPQELAFADNIGSGMPFLTNGGVLKVSLNGIDYDLGLIHKSRFHSSLNVTNANKRVFDLRWPVDLIAIGHHHVASIEQTSRLEGPYKKDVIFVRTGTYKVDDGYSQSEGFGHGQPGGTIVILDSKEKKMTPFYNLDDGIQYLKLLKQLPHYKHI